jgi:hypothetical protein
MWVIDQSVHHEQRLYIYTVYLYYTYAEYRCKFSLTQPHTNCSSQLAPLIASTRTLFKPPPLPHPHIGFHCHLLRRRLPPQELRRHRCCCSAPSIAVHGSGHPLAPPVAAMAGPPPTPLVVAPQGHPRATRTSTTNKSLMPPHGSSA